MSKPSVADLKNELAALKAECSKVKSNFFNTINNSLNGIIIVNHSGMILYANPAAHHLFNKSPDQLNGHEFGFPVLDKETAEIEIPHKNGKIHSVEMKVIDTEWNQEPAFLITFYDITESKFIKNRLKEKETQLQRILNTAAEALWEIDRNGTILFANPSFCNFFGRTKENVVGKSLYDFFGKEYTYLFNTYMENPEWGEPFRFDCNIGGKINNPLWVLVSLSLTKDKNDNIIGALGLMTDISSHKKTEEAFKQTAFKLNHFKENSQLAFVEVSPDFKIISWNKAAENIFGYTSSEVLDKTANIIIPKEEYPNIKHLFKELLLKKGGFETKTFNQHKTGKIVYCHWMNGLITDHKGNILSIISLGRDITEEQKEQKAIIESQKNLTAILSSIDAAVFTLNPDLKINLSNQSAKELFQYSESELLDMDFKQLFSKSHKSDFFNNIKSFLTSDSLVLRNKHTQEIKARSRSGKEWDAEISITKIKIFGKQKLIALVLDITERKHQQQQFMRSQRLESIGLLTSGIVHEMNDVLTPILLSIEYLKYITKDIDAQECLVSLEKSSKLGQELIEQLLTFARGKETDYTLLNASRLLYDIDLLIQETFPKNITTNLNIAEELWPIITHPTEFQQIIMNICVNSKQAMPEGGHIEISAKNLFIDENFVQQHLEAQSGPHVLIKICDNGMGIQKDHLQKIFDPFFTTNSNNQGSGLGLSTVYSLMKNHKGFIDVRSKPNEQTCVSLYFPASKPRVQESNIEINKSDLQGNGELILLVDDEPTILSMMKSVLKRHNYQVMTANDGSEALALFAQNKPHISGVVVDMMMPVMDGYATIQALLAMKPDIKIVAISGLTDTTALINKFSDNLANLTKPFNAEALLFTINKILKS